MIFSHSRPKITFLHLFLSIYFFTKWLFHIESGFILFYVISSSYCGVWFCVVVLLQRFVFHCLVTVFYLCVGDLDRKNIFYQTKTKNQIMVVSMLQNYILVNIVLSISML